MYNETHYLTLSRILKDNKYCGYLNHGFYPIHKKIEGLDIVFKTSASLYLNSIEKTLKELTSETVLEVSSGRGGGASLLKQLYPSIKYTGCDAHSKNVEFCKKTYKDISFDLCNAEELIYNDSTFDVVLNIEASHCYEDKYKFFSEVHRVLKDTGYFIYIDCFADFNDGIDLCVDFFKIIQKIDITDNVANSCKHMSEELCHPSDYITLSQARLQKSIFDSKIKPYSTRENIFLIYLLEKK